MLTAPTEIATSIVVCYWLELNWKQASMITLKAKLNPDLHNTQSENLTLSLMLLQRVPALQGMSVNHTYTNIILYGSDQ